MTTGMEQHPSDTTEFISPEAEERIAFYKQWIRDVLTVGPAGIDDLIALRNKLTFDRYETDAARFKGVDMTPVQAVLADLTAKIAEEVADAVRDLEQTIFNAKLFEVGIVTDGDIRRVDGLVAVHESVLPLVAGEPYVGKIDAVVFDR